MRPGHHHPQRPHRRDRDAGRPAPPHPHVDRGRAGTPPDWAGRAARRPRPRDLRDCTSGARSTRASSMPCSPTSPSAGVRTLVSRPPTLEELFLRHYEPAAPGVAAESLAGTGALVRLALRRDRAVLPAVLLALVGTAAFSASATVDLYPTVEARVHAAQTSNATPALVALYGRIYDETSIGAISPHQDEQPRRVDGRRARRAPRHPAHPQRGGGRPARARRCHRRRPVRPAHRGAGRRRPGQRRASARSPPSASSPPGCRRSGPLAFGLSWAATGLAFAGVGAIAAQLTPSTAGGHRHRDRCHRRAPTSCGPSATSSATTARAGSRGCRRIGWAQQVRAYAGDRWAVLFLLLVFAAVAVAVAFGSPAGATSVRGCWPDRPGPGHRPGATCRRRSAWPGGCSAACCSPTPSRFALVGVVIGATATGRRRPARQRGGP